MNIESFMNISFIKNLIKFFKYIVSKITPSISINIGNEKPYKVLENFTSANPSQVLSVIIKNNSFLRSSNLKFYLTIKLADNEFHTIHIGNTFSLEFFQEIVIPYASYTHSNQPNAINSITLYADQRGYYFNKLYTPPASNGERYRAILQLKQYDLKNKEKITREVNCEIWVDENMQLIVAER